ncbi:hypothetical protein SMGD1_1474 [Sulfurimonas gotlandica GD1]|jgi:hypothetical protein|uniref:Uncharacterized protein n=1 Tax=Sulfurimonas gotlandica (strain DSM 19862 / JCM 16533 / GD1) TaxID=929558 RepID=B6BHK0_SULGG|nr:hypothetical protein [Sulfurimonas gotlandica]EDZ63368.1 hypothetical protein CBGD1_988 [Sulfurimonas gotlandica GD1]EHP29998.1 hypothetical protein SMGD1_1474 [Sulfurimonas gotlandica GD1]
MIESIFNRINVEIKRTYYTHERYNSKSTFALIYHEKALTPEELAVFVRISDKFVIIDENHCFINFTFTTQEDAFKASQNLLMYLDNHFNSRTTCIAIDTFNVLNSAKEVMNRLTQILKETRRNSYTRIEDEDILNGVL